MASPLRRFVFHGWRFLRRHPGSSLLSGIGVFAALLLLTLTHASRRGTDAELARQFRGLGQDTALLYVHEKRPLPERFFRGLHQLCLDRRWQFVPVFETPVHAGISGAPRQTRLLHSTPDFLPAFVPRLRWGRLPEDRDRHIARLLLGRDLAQELAFDTSNPHVKADGRWYQVLGVLDGLDHGGAQIHQFLDLDNALLAIDDPEKLADQERPLRFALIRLSEDDQHDELEAAFADLRLRNGLEQLAVELRLPLRQATLAARSRGLLLAHGSLVSLVCLSLGCLAILLSYQLQLNYRREEFGTLMALGAGPLDLAGNILAEVVILCLSGGTAGVLVGALCAQLQAAMGAAMQLHPGDLIHSLVVLSLAAAVTGVIPALRTARMDPITLLRMSR